MKILWLCNIVLPELADEFGFRQQRVGGWLSGAWNELKKQDQCELAVCVPVRNPIRAKDGFFDGYRYYSFITISIESNTNIHDQIIRFTDIISDFRPDVIHIWGTEYEHSYSMVKACEQLGFIDKVLVSIQGLLTYCEKIYEYGIPEEIVLNKINGISLRDERESFFIRSKYEKHTLQLVKFVSGRTDWDRACIREINPNAKYLYCGEVLRDKFYYAKKWTIEKCEKHSVFISQASYPIKGFHLVLGEIKKLSMIYPDLKVKVAGKELLEAESAYAKYIRDTISSLGIDSNIVFLGTLDEDHMIDEYLKSNIFLSASVMENSSNSVCEAMMLGVPVVSTFVGGMSSIIEHNISGLLYPVTETHMMTYYVQEVFENSIDVKALSKNEIKRAECINSKYTNINRLLELYKVRMQI